MAAGGTGRGRRTCRPRAVMSVRVDVRGDTHTCTPAARSCALTSSGFTPSCTARGPPRQSSSVPGPLAPALNQIVDAAN